MHASQPIPAGAFATDANRHGEAVSAPPEWLAYLLARLIHLMLRTMRVLRPRSLSYLPDWMLERPDLPASSALALAASVRGEFGTAIAWMCMRRGIGPGHRHWPYLAHSIVAFGGSLQGVDGRRYPMQWWESHWASPAVVRPDPAPPSATALLLEREAIALAPLSEWQAAPASAARAPAPAPLPAATLLRPASPPPSWLRPWARDGTGPPTGPPCIAAPPPSSCLTHGAGPRPAPPY